MVRELGLEVRPGEVVALLGPNGAGKTTTLETIAGLNRPLAGTIELSGEDIMAVLGIKPGPAVGKAWNHLLELRLDQGELGRDRVTQELLSRASREGLADSQ